MINKIFIGLFLAALVISCKNEKTKESSDLSTVIVDTPTIVTHKLNLKWETDTTFKVPESVIFDAKNQVLYVANIDGKEPWGADGKGSIGKLGLDGKIIQVEWVKGLNAPKGMALLQDKLYVADLTEIAVIDIASGKIDRKIKVPGAKGLNDVSIDGAGIIYVTDSQGKRLYRVENNSASILLDTLAGPNGVLLHGRDLYLMNAGGFYKVTKKNTLSMLADGMEGGTDGVEHVQGEDFIASCWAGAIWYLNGDGRKELLYDGKAVGKNTADIGFNPATKTVYVPTFWKNSVMAFEVASN